MDSTSIFEDSDGGGTHSDPLHDASDITNNAVPTSRYHQHPQNG